MWLLVWLMMGVVPSGNTPAAGAPGEPPHATRSGKELERAIHDALRRWANPSNEEIEAAAREFLALYHELSQDTKLPQTIHRQLVGKLRFRLANLARKLSRQSAEETSASSSLPPLVGRPSTEGFLAQRGGRSGEWGRFGGFNQPHGSYPYNAGDAGEELVELIQRTIAPRSWARLGGPGTIYYWRPGHAIIARAPEYVHEQIGELLQQMNPQGR